MRRLLAVGATVLFTAAGAFAAEQTWTGQISDSMCGAKHGMANMTDRACTEMCIKGGSKYVFVSKEKVYTITNQDNKDLATHAGHTVMLTGEPKGEAITVSRIQMPATSGHDRR